MLWAIHGTREDGSFGRQLFQMSCVIVEAMDTNSNQHHPEHGTVGATLGGSSQRTGADLAPFCTLVESSSSSNTNHVPNLEGRQESDQPGPNVSTFHGSIDSFDFAGPFLVGDGTHEQNLGVAEFDNMDSYQGLDFFSHDLTFPEQNLGSDNGTSVG